MKLCGVLNIDKSIGLTSREVVDRVVKLVRPAKVGHAGTLDPLATGVLVVCVGHATRLINLIQEGRKQYLARFVLGQRSDTDDITGTITAGGDWSHVTKDRLASALLEFTGQILQVPPQFSAVHIQGQRAYDLARRGQAVEIDARPVEVFSIRLTDFRPPEFELEIECGSGTYIRSIGRDLGSMFGCGALMTQLRRMTVGAFPVSEAVPVESLTHETVCRVLQPALRVVSDFRSRKLTIEEAVAIRCGQSIRAVVESGQAPQAIDQPSVRESTEARTALIGNDGNLLGIAEFVAGRLQPRIIFPADDPA